LSCSNLLRQKCSAHLFYHTCPVFVNPFFTFRSSSILAFTTNPPKPFFGALGWSRTGTGCDAAADRLKAPVLGQRAPYVLLRFHPSKSVSARTQPAPAREYPKTPKIALKWRSACTREKTM